ncbi:MAG: T9SS type A sorting domain-containing protein, partial [Ignavibacteria bacterium]|nr:T9SS type A sorting domain-containing protein [Ignavibacteria bacterium]
QLNSAWLDNNANSYITGFTADTSQVIKTLTQMYDSTGTILWSRVFMPPAYNQSIGNSVTVSSGGVYSACMLRRANGTYVTAVLRYDFAGNLTNSAVFSKTNQSSEVPVTVCTDSSGAVYVLGKTNAISGSDDILMLKYDAALNLKWQSTFSGTAVGNDVPVQMMISKDNKIVVCAGMSNLPGGLDYGLYRFDTNAAVIMIYNYNGTGNNQDLPYAITCDTANNIFVTGGSRNADTLGSEDFYTIKLDPTSQLIWGKRFNGIGRGLDYGTSIAVDRLGNVYAGGCFDKHDNHIAFGLLKYGPTGDLHWLEEYSMLELSEDFLYTTAVDKNFNIFVTGISFDSTTDYDIATIKYSQPIGVEPVNSHVPDSYKLYPAYPNPFNPVTKIRFAIPSGTSAAQTFLSVYDILGKEVAMLVKQNLLPGTYEVEWNASAYPSGIYFCTLKSGAFRETKKMILIK